MRLDGRAMTALLLVGTRAGAADMPPSPLRLDDAIGFALAHHPSLRTQAALEEGAAAEVGVSRAAELPYVDLTAQWNRGTANVVPGALFGMSGIPPISGPPTGRTFDSGVWGSAVGIGAAWDAVGLAQRIAQVDAALAERGRARAAIEARRLAVAHAAGDAYLVSLANHEAVRAAQANLARASVFRTTVKALVDQDLRPGADLSRAEAEVALASTQLARAEQAEAVARARMAEALGVAGTAVTLAADAQLPTPPSMLPATGRRHPVLVEADAAVGTARAREHAVALSYLPRLDLVAALWVRASGKFPGGFDLGAAQGLVPDTPNWAAGINFTWPVLDLVLTRARVRVERAGVHAASARAEELRQAIASQIDEASAILAGARRVAANTPVALAAARDAERQSTARYQAGLATAVDVADTERVLAQAEIDDAVARLGVWRSLLLVARAAGDIDPFLDEARLPSLRPQGEAPRREPGR